MVRAVIVGTGNQAHGLSHMFSISNSESVSDNMLSVTKKQGLNAGDSFHETDVKLADFEESVTMADIVILCIPAKVLKVFVNENYSILKEKILVDATNSSDPGEDLDALLGATDVRWVKAFNDVGAVDLLTKKPFGKTKVSAKICSPDAQSAEVVKSFAEASLGMNVKTIPYEQYHTIATHQDTLGDEWISATVVLLITFALSMVYNIVRHPVIKGYPWRQFPLFVMNKSISWVCLWGFAYSQLPGMFARVYDAWYRDSLRPKPRWLVNFLAMRKHLGLLSLWFLTVHIFMSCLMFSIAYYSRFFYDKTDPMSRMSANGESSFMFGTIGAALYIILGICSLPSVAEQMTSAQWNFVYGPVAWTSLAFGTGHVVAQGIKVTWNNPDGWAGGLPPITLVSTAFPLIVMGLKVLQVVFVRFMDFRHRKPVAEMTASNLVEKKSTGSSTDE